MHLPAGGFDVDGGAVEGQGDGKTTAGNSGAIRTIELLYRHTEGGSVTCQPRSSSSLALVVTEFRRLANLVETSPDLLRQIAFKGGRYRIVRASSSHEVHLRGAS